MKYWKTAYTSTDLQGAKQESNCISVPWDKLAWAQTLLSAAELWGFCEAEELPLTLGRENPHKKKEYW